MNQKVIITRGLSGAGKSTWSKKFSEENPTYIRISRDDLRFMLWNGDMVNNDKEVIQARDSLIWAFIVKGYNLVLDETYLAPHRIEEISSWLNDARYALGIHLDIEIKDFIDVPLKKCIEQNKPRGKNRFVPEDFIREYHEKYVKPLLKDPGITEWTI